MIARVYFAQTRMYSKIPLVRPVLRANTTDTRVIKNKKNLDISVESQITRNFVKNPFGNCRPPLEVFHFFRSERKTTVISSPFAKFSSFQSLISRKQLRKIELQMVSAISFGWFADFGKTLTIIQRSSQPVYSERSPLSNHDLPFETHT